MSWPKLVSAPRSPDPAGWGSGADQPEDAYVASVVGFLDAITRWRNALPDPARVLLAWRETYPQHFVTSCVEILRIVARDLRHRADAVTGKTSRRRRGAPEV
jgi:hypothetical protein